MSVNTRRSSKYKDPGYAGISVLCILMHFRSSGLEFIKLEFLLKLKIKRNNWLLALYFEFEAVLNFYNLRPDLIQCVWNDSLNMHISSCLMLEFLNKNNFSPCFYLSKRAYSDKVFYLGLHCLPK